MRVGSKVGTFLPNFGTHARPLGSRIIRCARDGRTDGQKRRFIAPFPTIGA